MEFLTEPKIEILDGSVLRMKDGNSSNSTLKLRQHPVGDNLADWSEEAQVEEFTIDVWIDELKDVKNMQIVLKRLTLLERISKLYPDLKL